MALPCFVWMLSECGHISALPPGTSSTDALATGPVYELVLRSQPSVRLLYMHTPNSNVNAQASSLAGHTVNGDACLVFSPSTASAFASPAVLLDSLLQPSATAKQHQHQGHSPSQSRRSSRSCSGSLRSGCGPQTRAAPRYTPTGPEREVLAAAAFGSAPAGIVPGSLSSSPVTGNHSACQAAEQPWGAGSGCGGRQQQPLQPQQHVGLQHAHSSPQQRVLAMRAILGSRNATGAAAGAADAAAAAVAAAAAAATAVSCGRSAAAPESMASLSRHIEEVDIPGGVRGTVAVDAASGAAVAVAAAVAPGRTDCPAGGRWLLRRPGGEAQEEPPCKSARSSGEFHTPRRASAAGADPWVAATAVLSLSAWGAEHASTAAAPAQQHETCAVGALGSNWHQPPQQLTMVQEAAGGAWMELDDEHDGGVGCHPGGSNTNAAAAAAAADGPSGPGGGTVDQFADFAGQRRGWQKGEGAQLPGAVAATPAPVGRTEEADGTAGQVATAAVGEEAAAAQEEVEDAAAAAAVTVPWGDLASDAVACIAMQLPPQASQAQAMAAVCRGWRAALLGHTPLLRKTAFALDPARPLRPAAGEPGGPRPGAAGPISPLPPPATASGSRAAASATAAAAEDGDASVLAAAMSRQHAAGAFLLPSHGTRQQDEREHEWEQAGAGAGAGTSSGAERAGAAASAAAALLRGGAAQSLPPLLLAAARASNPSAQLVLAQLLEAADDARGSLRWWRKLAATGDAMAMFKLGMASYDGSHGLQPDPEAAHLWLSRTVRGILRVDSLSAISLDGHQGAGAGASAAAAAASTEAAAPAQGPRQQRQQHGGGRISLALKATVSALDAPRRHMLGCSAIVLGYLEFDGVAGRAVWGMGERSEAVRLFRLAEGCGLTEASAVLGWLYNTGQY